MASIYQKGWTRQDFACISRPNACFTSAASKPRSPLSKKALSFMVMAASGASFVARTAYGVGYGDFISFSG